MFFILLEVFVRESTFSCIKVSLGIPNASTIAPPAITSVAFFFLLALFWRVLPTEILFVFLPGIFVALSSKEFTSSRPNFLPFDMVPSNVIFKFSYEPA